MTKTVDQLLEDMESGKEKRVKKFKDLIKEMLYNTKDPDYDKIRPGTDYYSGKTEYYPNGAVMTYCNIFVYLFLQRLKINIDNLLGIDFRSNKPSVYYTPISLFLKMMLSHDIATECDFIQAQNLAKQGCPVVAIVPEKYNKNGYLLDAGHIALVYPQDEIQKIESDVMIAGAGSRAVWGLKSCHDVFLKYGYIPRYFTIRSN